MKQAGNGARNGGVLNQHAFFHIHSVPDADAAGDGRAHPSARTRRIFAAIANAVNWCLHGVAKGDAVAIGGKPLAQPF